LKEPLPVNPQPIAGEWLGSWLLRLAQANTMSLRHLLNHFNLDLKSLPLSIGTIRKLGKLTLQQPSSLTDLLETPTLTLQHKPDMHRILTFDIQLFSAQRVQLCIPCLQSDATPYIRTAWMNRTAYHCHLHRVFLLRRCPHCRAVLSVMHEFGRLTDYLNSEASLLLICLKCGYDLRDSETVPVQSNKIERLNYTPFSTYRWPEFTMSLYLFVEKYQLSTTIDFDGPRVIKGLSLHRTPALQNINSVARTHRFFDSLLFYLTLGTHSIAIDRLKLFGSLCYSIAEISENATELSACRFFWLGDLLMREPEEWLASNIQAILYALTLDDAPWVRTDSQIEFDLELHQKSIVSIRVFGQPGHHRRLGFKKYLDFLSVIARTPSRYDMMMRLMKNKHSDVPLHCYEKDFIASIFTDLYIDCKISQPREFNLEFAYENLLPQSNTKKLLHSSGALELLRIHNYKIFRLILSNYANARTHLAQA
jgi:RNase P subunit RPR2